MTIDEPSPADYGAPPEPETLEYTPPPPEPPPSPPEPAPQLPTFADELKALCAKYRDMGAHQMKVDLQNRQHYVDRGRI